MLTTKINWALHDYCQSQCSYCPKRFWGGETPRHITEYMRVLALIVTHFKNLDRNIEWSFDGGEPLDIHDFPMMLKYCKENDGKISLTSNGGRLWLDWWAVEPHVDYLNLSYHYWQNEKLIEFILNVFTKKQKRIDVNVPIRHTHFGEDVSRALSLQKKFGSFVCMTPLYKDFSTAAGLYEYSEHQLRIIGGDNLVEQYLAHKKTTFMEKLEEQFVSNPVFTGKPCNVGIERVYISPQGWASGSICNNTHLGNIWDEGWGLPLEPSICTRISCNNPDDQLITKF